MAKTSPTKEARPWLVQMYFVLASLIGLILIVISGVNISRLVLNQLLGVKQYPSFSAPYPPMREPSMVPSSDGEMTEEQKVELEKWEAEYKAWQEEEKAYNSEDQNRRRQIAEALAMLIVGIPVFALHAPYVFKRS